MEFGIDYVNILLSLCNGILYLDGIPYCKNTRKQNSAAIIGNSVTNRDGIRGGSSDGIPFRKIRRTLYPKSWDFIPTLRFFFIFSI